MPLGHNDDALLAWLGLKKNPFFVIETSFVVTGKLMLVLLFFLLTGISYPLSLFFTWCCQARHIDVFSSKIDYISLLFYCIT